MQVSRSPGPGLETTDLEAQETSAGVRRQSADQGGTSGVYHISLEDLSFTFWNQGHKHI